MSEILSVYDEDYSFVRKAPRKEIHEKGFWHETLHCWIAGEIDGKKSIVVQQRSKTAETYPGKLDITAAGHLLHKESPIDFREIREEIGIVPEEIYYIGTTKDSSRDHDIIDNQFNHTYLARLDKSPKEYLAEKSIQAFAVIELNDFYKIFEKSAKVKTPFYSGEGKKNRLVSSKDFVPRKDDYYAEIASLGLEMFERRGGLSLREGRFFLKASP